MKIAPAALQDIKDANERLSVADTALSELIQQIAAALTAVVSVRIETALTPELTLAWMKHDNAWAFVVLHENKKTPLLSAPRQWRTDSIGAIRQLVRDAPEQLRRMIAQREVALSEAQNLLHELAVPQ